MKLPSRLFRSRHGVFYFRIQYYVESKRIDRRFSLQTKSPTVAKAKALQISAIMARSKKAGADMSRFNPDDPSTWDGVLGEKDSLRKLDIELQNGVSLRNINTPEEREYAEKVIQQFLQIKSADDQARFVSASNPQNVPQTPVQPEAPLGGMTLGEVIKRYATRNSSKLKKKTLYEYGKYHKKFEGWVTLRENNEHYPIRLITRADIGDYIDDLKAQTKPPISDNTIQQKYLASIGGLFELAQSLDAYPMGEIPTRGHKLFTKKDKRKAQSSKARKPYTSEDLALIFNPDVYLKNREKPDDFWLPLLALFSGARISELCQLALTDVRQVDGIWSISINDEDYKELKTPAARRIIPVHPQLLSLGFLDYVEDAKPFGGMLFPHLTADPMGNFSATPSERYSAYLRKTVGIVDTRKVFHSYRFTANDALKQHGVSEETRSQFIGHEHETTNSTVYSDPHSVRYLLENVAPKLEYPTVSFDRLTYRKGGFSDKLAKLCRDKERMLNNRKVRLERQAKKNDQEPSLPPKR